MDEELLRAQIEARVAQELAESEARIAELEARDRDVVSAAAKASNAYHKAAGKNMDKPLTAKAEQLRRAMLSQVAAVENMGGAIAAARERHRLLSHPSVVEKRLEEELRFLKRVRGREKTPGLRQLRRRREPTKRSKRMPRERTQAPAGVQNKIIKLIESGMGGPTIARQLEGSRTENPFGGEWKARHVRQIYKDATGTDDWSAMRKKNPIGSAAEKPARSRGQKATPARAAGRKRSGNGNGNGNGRKKANGNGRRGRNGNGPAKGNARPLSKSAQAAGTSRGGTGRKAKATSQASSTRRGSKRSGSSAAKKTTGKRTGRKAK